MKACQKQIVSLLVALVMLVLALAGCITPTATPTAPPPTNTPVPAEPPVDLTLIEGAEESFQCVFYVDGAPSDTPEPLEITANESPYFVDNQVIVSGPIDAVNAIRSALAGEFQLEPLELCDLRYQGDKSETTIENEELPFTPSRGVTGVPPAPPDGVDLSGQVFVLFQVSGGDLAEAIEAINTEGNGIGVYADPNYLTGPLAVSPCGNPFEVGGSPFEVGGSPFEVGGSPFEVGGSSAAATQGLAQADAGVFWEQWAFAQNNIRQGASSGEQIRVAVFDTIPAAAELPIDHPVNTADQEFEIHLVPASRTNLLAPVVPNSADVSDHGVFVAGLINAVSGVQEIDLYEVLNGAGCGDLQTLSRALHGYTSTVLASNDGSMQGVVINLSLGVHQPEKLPDARLPKEIVLLEDVLSFAYQNEAVIVAAAGNNSAELEAPLNSDLPADYAYVIGVAATNIEGERACYSNKGDVAAPGGDGGPLDQATLASLAVPITPHVEDLDRTCAPLAVGCHPGDADCPYGVVSYSPGSATSYRFWVGTSFAAPLVSGIAALLLDDGHLPMEVPFVIGGWVVDTHVDDDLDAGSIQAIDTLPTP
jgi:subtilisin family serine protease